MFYVYLISKILLFYLLPYFAITRKASKTLINVKSILLFSWLVYLAFLTYIPFIDYYFENEEDLISIQEDISFSEEVQIEDINICERIQIGLKSDGFAHGIFSKKYETGVSHFQSYIDKKINNG